MDEIVETLDELSKQDRRTIDNLVNRVTKLKSEYDKKYIRVTKETKKAHEELKRIKNIIVDHVIEAQNYGFSLASFVRRVPNITDTQLKNWLVERKRDTQGVEDSIIREIEMKKEEVDQKALNRVKKGLSSAKKLTAVEAVNLYEKEKSKTKDDVFLDRCLGFADRILEFSTRYDTSKFDQADITALIKLLNKSLELLKEGNHAPVRNTHTKDAQNELH